MDVKGGIGTVGNYEVKLEGGVLSISLGASYPLKDAAIAIIQKVEDSNPGMNALEKEALEVVKSVLQKMP